MFADVFTVVAEVAPAVFAWDVGSLVLTGAEVPTTVDAGVDVLSTIFAGAALSGAGMLKLILEP